MAFTARAETYARGSSLSTPFDFTINKATGVVDGDIMFMFLAIYIATPPTVDSVPSGWTLVATNTTAYSRWYLYYKIASSEGTNYTWSLTASCKYYALNIAYSSGDFDVQSIDDITAISNTLYGTAGTAVRAASMSVPAANSPLVYFGAVTSSSSRTFTKPSVPTSDWVEDADEGHLTPDLWLTIGSMVWTGSGATGDMDIACSESITTNKHAFAVALKPEGLSGAADITGVGALSSIGKVLKVAVIVLSGAGALTAIPRLVGATYVTLLGSGALTISAEVTHAAIQGAALLQGQGTLITVGEIAETWIYTEWQNSLITDSTFFEDLIGLEADSIYEFQAQARHESTQQEGAWSESEFFETVAFITASAALGGQGTLSIIGSCIFIGASSIIGEGSLIIEGRLTKTSSSILGGVGSLVISSTVVKNGETILQGVGTLETTAHLILAGLSTLEGVGTLTSSGEIVGWVEGQASLQGIGTLISSATLSLAGASSLEGIGSLTVEGGVPTLAQAQLQGVGSLTVSARLIRYGGSQLAGIGLLTTSASVLYAGVSNLQGVGTLTVEVSGVKIGSASLNGIGTLLILASLYKSSESSLSGIGSLSVAAITFTAVQSVLIGTGTLATAACLLMRGQQSMIGIGTLTAGWSEYISRHQDWIWKLPDRDLVMAIPKRDLTMSMPARTLTLKVREHE